MNIVNQFKHLEAVDWLIICLALTAYAPLIWAVIEDKEKRAGQNFYTWILWLVLDWIQCICLMMAQGTYVMFLAFIPCATFITIRTYGTRKRITPFEKNIAYLVVGCVVVWIVFGGMVAIVFETISQIIAGLPMLKDTYKRPKEFVKTLIPLFVFVIVHTISFFRVKGFAIEHTLFPGMMLIFTILSIIPIAVYLIKNKTEKMPSSP